ncbi:hypothetical protein PanWU01x14_363700, partial [Parasponia andersonii]
DTLQSSIGGDKALQRLCIDHPGSTTQLTIDMFFVAGLVVVVILLLPVSSSSFEI